VEKTAQQRQTVANLRAAQDNLRRTTVDPSMDDPEWKAMVEHTQQIRVAKFTADEELQRALRFSNDELAGREGTPDLSGIPGVGPKRRAAAEQITNAQRRVDELAKGTLPKPINGSRRCARRSRPSGKGSRCDSSVRCEGGAIPLSSIPEGAFSTTIDGESMALVGLDALPEQHLIADNSDVLSVVNELRDGFALGTAAILIGYAKTAT
jgi:hypothetical protein